ncbi:LysR family transcriptional regulator [Paracoccus limosus]|jgi:LysR family glycine cleavage system transcriptional activator|uniref:LysR family transcriptional regulator n=1 Tax=Paracoccus limosus TaxID=913252 RepID=A0A844H7P5_9RHOB|nr:LysR family transcriptional regulator [Paracoccus limosus]MTH34368.1 LysR family transcriptional regulator [Paracoccus limosus]
MAQPPLTALRAFEAVARTGSFRAAAEALFVTQPAISHQVRHLEQWLGAPLFDRSGRVPVLLPRGVALARELTMALDAIETACRRARPAAEGGLVVAAIPSVAICWLIPRLPRFRARHPEIQLRVVYAYHGQDIDFAATDLAFTFGETCPAGAGIQARRFLPGVCVPVASPRLVGALPAELTLPWLLQVGLLHDNDMTGWQTWLGRAGQPVPAHLPGAIFEDFNLLRAAALAGQGVALCARAMVEPDLAEGRLVALSDIAVLEGFSYYLTRSDRVAMDAARQRARQAFLDWIAEEEGA